MVTLHLHTDSYIIIKDCQISAHTVRSKAALSSISAFSCPETLPSQLGFSVRLTCAQLLLPVWHSSSIIPSPRAMPDTWETLRHHHWIHENQLSSDRTVGKFLGNHGLGCLPSKMKDSVLSSPPSFALCISSCPSSWPPSGFLSHSFPWHKAASLGLCSLMHVSYRTRDPCSRQCSLHQPNPEPTADRQQSAPGDFSQGLLKVFIKGGQTKHNTSREERWHGFINGPVRVKNHESFLSIPIFKLQLQDG